MLYFINPTCKYEDMAAKTSQIMAYPPLCLTVGGVLTCCTWLSPNMVLCIIAIDLHFGLFRENRFSSDSPSKQAILVRD